METVITLKPHNLSREDLRKYARKNKIKNLKKEFHTTIYCAETVPLFKDNGELYKKINSYLPVILNVNTYYFDLFGNRDKLVLRYKNSKVEKLHDLLIKEALEQMVFWEDYSQNENHRRILEKHNNHRENNFNSHITLAENFKKNNLKKLSCFNQEIILTKMEMHYKD